MYKIEIWSYHEKIDEYENNNIQKILQWFIDKGYKMLDEYGECCFCVFNDKISGITPFPQPTSKIFLSLILNLTKLANITLSKEKEK